MLPNTEIEEYDVVALTQDLPEHDLVRGNVGTVVMKYSPTDYEVEFVSADGGNYGLLTLHASQLMRLHYAPVPLSA